MESHLNAMYICVFLLHPLLRQIHETTRWVGRWRKIQRKDDANEIWTIPEWPTYHLSHFGNFNRLIRYQNMWATFQTIATHSFIRKSLLFECYHSRSYCLHSTKSLTRKKNYCLALSDRYDSANKKSLFFFFVFAERWWHCEGFLNGCVVCTACNSSMEQSTYVKW